MAVIDAVVSDKYDEKTAWIKVPGGYSGPDKFVDLKECVDAQRPPNICSSHLLLLRLRLTPSLARALLCCAGSRRGT